MSGNVAPIKASAKSRSGRMQILLVLSFAPLLIKSISYAMIGSYLPLFVFVSFAIIVTRAVQTGSALGVVGIRAWSVGLVLWGSTRLGLMSAMLFTSTGEAHVHAQFTFWYVALSLLHCVVGIILLRQDRKR